MALRRDRNLIKGLKAYKPFREFGKAVTGLLGVAGLHSASMMFFEGLPLRDAWWLTVTTLSTTGYGDISPQTDLGRLTTLFLPYAIGIPLVAQSATLFYEHRQHKKNLILEGKKRWTMDDHIVFLNIPKTNPKDYYKQLMRELRKSQLPGSNRQALIVSDNLVNNELPDELRELGVAHVSHNANDEKAFENSSLKSAGVIVVLCRDEDDPDADSITYHLVSRARRENPDALIIAEAVHERNKDGIYAEGADHIMRPMRTYPEMLMRAILAPGTEQLAENLFSSKDAECVRYDLNLRAKWSDVAGSVICADIGTPVAYVSQDNRVIADMRGSDEIDAKALMVLARADDIRSKWEVSSALRSYQSHVEIENLPEIEGPN